MITNQRLRASSRPDVRVLLRYGGDAHGRRPPLLQPRRRRRREQQQPQLQDPPGPGHGDRGGTRGGDVRLLLVDLPEAEDVGQVAEAAGNRGVQQEGEGGEGDRCCTQ